MSGTESVRETQASSSDVPAVKSIDMGDSTSLHLRSRNYHIKAIRKGVPDILSTDPRGKTKLIVSTGRLSVFSP